MTVCLLIVESVSGSEQNCSWSLMVQVCNCQWTKAYRFVLLLYQRWKNKTLKSPPLRAVRKLHQQQRGRSHLQLLKTAWTATAPKSLNHRRHRQTHLHKAMRQEAKVKFELFTRLIICWWHDCLCVFVTQEPLGTCSGYSRLCCLPVTVVALFWRNMLICNYVRCFVVDHYVTTEMTSCNLMY